MLYTLPEAGFGYTSGGVSPKKNAGANATPGVFSGDNAALHLLRTTCFFRGSESPAIAGRRAGKFRIT
jgi:hypothetical protein